MKGIDAFVKILGKWRRKEGNRISDPYKCDALGLVELIDANGIDVAQPIIWS